MNVFKPTVSYISPATKVREWVRELIPDFQKFCLESDYDTIVPIESEGFSLLWPKLKRDHAAHPQIIPSSVVKRARQEDFVGKKVLIVDASTYSGQTILFYKNLIDENFPGAKIDLASMLVFKGIQDTIQFVNENKLLLTQNQYDWAREVVAQYISSNVFMHYGDPPLWAFRYREGEKDKLFDSLEKSGTLYSLPDYGDDSSEWQRYIIDDISLQDRRWLPPQIEPEEFIKIRLFIHKKEPIILVLPLFFPSVPVNTESGLVEILSSAKAYFPSGFNEILRFAEEVPHDPYIYVRWISTVGSMLLWRDFYKRLVKSGIVLSPEDALLQGPIPNLRNYSCRREVLEGFEDVMTSLISSNEAANFASVFSFGLTKGITQYKEPMNPELEFVPPEQYLAAAIGIVSISAANEIRQAGGSAAIPILCEFTYPEIRAAANELTLVGVNRALDVLVDEGLVNLCFKEDANNRIHRGYYVGGESKRRVLETLGYAFQDIIPASL